MIKTGYITRAGDEVVISDYPDGKKMVVLMDRNLLIRKAPRAKMGTMEQAMRCVVSGVLKGDFIVKEGKE